MVPHWSGTDVNVAPNGHFFGGSFGDDFDYNSLYKDQIVRGNIFWHGDTPFRGDGLFSVTQSAKIEGGVETTTYTFEVNNLRNGAAQLVLNTTRLKTIKIFYYLNFTTGYTTAKVLGFVYKNQPDKLFDGKANEIDPKTGNIIKTKEQRDKEKAEAASGGDVDASSLRPSNK